MNVPHIVRLIRHVLIEADFTDVYPEIENIVKDNKTVCVNLIDRYEKNPKGFRLLNLNELKNLMTNVKTLTDPKWYQGDLSKLVGDPRQSVKEMSVLTDTQETEIAAKVRTLVESNSELQKWYECAESFFSHFKEEREKGRGHLVPRSYQMYVAADLCMQFAEGKERIVMTLGPGQGKTLVYLLVALMLSKDERTKAKFQKFTFLTSSSLLS